MTALVTTTSQQTGLATAPAHTVLGERDVRIPVSGKIRSGIKVLTKSAAGNANAVRIYSAGVAKGLSFDEIAKQIEATCQIAKGGLTPKNVPYFTARRCDFAMPEVADRINDLYGEDRGEGRHLYRIPVIFPVDAWQLVMPHALRAYTASQLVYWSDYGADGVRYCKTRGNVEIDPTTKRARRLFGGRPEVLRDENDGRCNPEACREYQARKCTLTASILFYIPGIPGSGAIEIPTNSFYSMQQIRQTLEMVAFVRGRISGLRPDGKALFHLAKKQSEISRIDPDTGKAGKVTQWLIQLEADIQIDALFLPQASTLAAGAHAAAALSGPAGIDDADDADDADEGPNDPPPIEGALVDADPPPAVQPPTTGARSITTEIRDLRRRMFAAFEASALDKKDFDIFAAVHWGEDWALTEFGLNAAIDALKDPSALREQFIPF